MEKTEVTVWLFHMQNPAGKQPCGTMRWTGISWLDDKGEVLGRYLTYVASGKIFPGFKMSFGSNVFFIDFIKCNSAPEREMGR